MEKLLIVSPHSDDALFCCSHTFFLPEYEVQVLTVENDAKRVTEDEKLFDFIGIPYQHLTVEFKDDSYYGFHKAYKEVNEETALEYLNEYFGTDKLKEIESVLVNWVKEFLKSNKDYRVMLPWGVGHPFHFFIRYVLENAMKFHNFYYYREFPHSYKRRSQPQVQKQLESGYFLSRSVPVEDFHEVKFELAKKFYRTQSGLLFFEQGYIKKQLPEEVYAKLPF